MYKIEKMRGFAGKNRSELLKIAQKMSDGRDSKEDLLIMKMGHATKLPYKPHPLSTLPMHTIIKRYLYKRTNVPTAKKRVTGKMNVHTRNR